MEIRLKTLSVLVSIAIATVNLAGNPFAPQLATGQNGGCGSAPPPDETCVCCEETLVWACDE